MRQHIYVAQKADGTSTVEISWQAGQYVLRIDDIREPMGEPDDLFRSNPASLEAILARLRARNIRLPEGMITALRDDRLLGGVRDENVYHQLIGDLYVRSTSRSHGGRL